VQNPFENQDSSYLVLRNDEDQYSLWPGQIAVPSGWQCVYGPDSRSACLAYVERHWTDMRPRSLVERMDRRGSATDSLT
jgi:MbtH protein